MEESDVFEDWNAIEGSIELETPPNELIIRTRNIPQLNVECSLDLLPSPHNHPNIAVSASLPIPYPTNTTIAPQWSPSPHSCPTTSPLLWPTISPTPSQQPLSPTTPSRVPFNITIDRDEAFEWRRRKSDVGCDLPTQDPILRQREERIRRRATAESSSSRGGGGAWWLWWRKQDQAGRQWQREQRVRKSLAEGKVRQYARTLANRGLYMCGLGNHRQNLGNALGITELCESGPDMKTEKNILC
ncbi:hypothetical protein BJ742DRAFT_838206 [Cladochytrium replicatum]|nr:hypothetical protein BJ742DRAFT_838206 [Cladochytrium replicatum]